MAAPDVTNLRMQFVNLLALTLEQYGREEEISTILMPFYHLTFAVSQALD